MKRPDWNSIWKNFVLNIAQRSPDPKFQVGAVIVTDDNTQVLALGYNGDQRGGPNCRDSLETGKSGFIHAEVNALRYARPDECYLLACNLLPCNDCLKLAASYGIKKIVFDKFYERDDSSLSIAKEFGLSLYHYGN